MKTENLNWAEAIRAYADGKRIRDRTGDEYWLDEAGEARHQSEAMSVMSPSFVPFSIVLPEEKSLSFEEALKAYIEGKTLFIDTELLRNTKFLAGANGTIKEALAMFDLAERRGWKITEITE